MRNTLESTQGPHPCTHGQRAVCCRRAPRTLPHCCTPESRAVAAAPWSVQRKRSGGSERHHHYAHITRMHHRALKDRRVSLSVTHIYEDSTQCCSVEVLIPCALSAARAWLTASVLPQTRSAWRLLPRASSALKMSSHPSRYHRCCYCRSSAGSWLGYLALAWKEYWPPRRHCCLSCEDSSVYLCTSLPRCYPVGLLPARHSHPARKRCWWISSPGGLRLRRPPPNSGCQWIHGLRAYRGSRNFVSHSGATRRCRWRIRWSGAGADSAQMPQKTPDRSGVPWHRGSSREARRSWVAADFLLRVSPPPLPRNLSSRGHLPRFSFA
eukprot:m.1036929 g.1036929  ORF g.1036929 m.1036929 type:complete len:324 (-) comp24140_c1_seq31:661-1632(-)